MAGLVLVLAIFLAYQPVWHAGFIWDDDGRITANPCVVGPLGLKEIWTTSAADICPLVETSFWAEHALWGLAPLPYHLVNVLLHAACALLLWQILKRLRVPGAWLGAALWALHPVQVETVAWVTEMKNTQSGLFYLLTIFFFIRHLEAEAAGERAQRRNYALTLVCAALAMASKSTAVVLPMILGLCAWWVKGRFRWRDVPQLAPIAVMALFPAALTLWTQKRPGLDPYELQFVRSFPERLATSGDAVWFYLGKLVWPHPLIFIYPRWKIDPSSAVSYLPSLAVIALLLVLWRQRETAARPYFFAFAYFVGALLPVLGFIDGFFWRYSLVGDHFQYLAAMGPLALGGAALAKCANFILPGKARLQALACTALLLVLGSLSWERAWVYVNEKMLWSDTIEQNPDCWMADNNLGLILMQEGRADDAITHFQTTLELNPGFARAHYNLGNALLQKGQVDDALVEYQKSIATDPDFPSAHFDLGLCFSRKGRIDEAIAEFRKTIALNPAHGKAHYNLGTALLQEGRLDEAIVQFQECLQLEPGERNAMEKLAQAQAMARPASSLK